MAQVSKNAITTRPPVALAEGEKLKRRRDLLGDDLTHEKPKPRAAPKSLLVKRQSKGDAVHQEAKKKPAEGKLGKAVLKEEMEALGKST